MAVWKAIVSFYQYLVINKVARSLFIFTFPCILLGGFIYGKYFIGHKEPQTQCEDCSYVKDVNKQLMSMVERWEKMLRPLSISTSTSFTGNTIQPSFASYVDTIIKPPSQQQQKKIVNKVLIEMDSLRFKLRQDSVKRIKNKSI